ncbi:MAG TPA: hypothetical protein PLX89_21030, partial [Verrucomicrobiota bacterium]|nr:hypothetical protein [Verrucomicrobiales bacterium]HRI15489.1 hypothetical protein [Verrucomicrobiota bacterium]
MSLETVIRFTIACTGFRPAREWERVRRCCKAHAYLLIALSTLGVSSRVPDVAAATPPSGGLHRTHLIDNWETREGLPENSATAYAWRH